MSQILHSASVKKLITKGLKAECKALKEKNIFPQLKVVLVGSDPASLIYTANKKKYCEKIGALCEIVALDEHISESDFLKTITQINEDQLVDGCIVQLPLPKQLSHLDVGSLVKKEKDVDGFHPENLYALMSNHLGPKNFISCTPKGILTLMQESQIEISGKHVVIVGRSMIVGKPLAMLLTNNNATVTLCHSHTKNLREITKNCDILISAIGKAQFIDETYISPDKNQVIIDVGMNTDTQGQLCGDVHYAKVENLVSAITPVPGGVGPMTIVSLAQNLLQASKNRLSL
ncbi:bifunctional 5,10-methylenetetrahydrofolate dehydrogenase/5,10-methenyltetrahydrofolate cyclohydrolase [Bacteriovorax stolpii]|uniref:Bifunctional protein FolD n=1 Tax=Bacteriovorax stolpii TaxID=960 RepID=A0A2K9NYE2_BACTC|nr:bifunctional 5,10-methylenetetrahydrofolate dehydrogenase/5,10-methenyltetrahydrofolate cyclohydrolase [Bacteriovorax stolpii]AUO00016.1 bifunctional methylenetetrahydrofolate dehydrogenase/methenyltetrahydrofolate cyclohydrolase [Bacteriovorax stolpii]QDK39992.1 bifunctional 5,10-methylenetetrahydrofolate dehydrogenase/5,10-methenyltetrahydrofolate cyclohydrolase [Bacteriovorax stolpii]TDP54092.1 methylenetetrahydrofolate dehydrogenase (NADP+)/methenyltetrahydrofolate cyclohydrolase [Bacteri